MSLARTGSTSTWTTPRASVAPAAAPMPSCTWCTGCGATVPTWWRRRWRRPRPCGAWRSRPGPPHRVPGRTGRVVRPLAGAAAHGRGAAVRDGVDHRAAGGDDRGSGVRELADRPGSGTSVAGDGLAAVAVAAHGADRRGRRRRGGGPRHRSGVRGLGGVGSTRAGGAVGPRDPVPCGRRSGDPADHGAGAGAHPWVVQSLDPPGQPCRLPGRAAARRRAHGGSAGLGRDLLGRGAGAVAHAVRRGGTPGVGRRPPSGLPSLQRAWERAARRVALAPVPA